MAQRRVYIECIPIIDNGREASLLEYMASTTTGLSKTKQLLFAQSFDNGR